MTDRSDAHAAFHEVQRAPATTLAWNVYGKGLESVGRDGRPETVPVAAPKTDQLLIRIDAVGLCFSDTKLIRQGGEHAKLYGRDLAKEPTRLGHETAITVVEVGRDLAGRFHSGDRFVIQPDIYVNGLSAAYGYTVPGGLIGYHTIGPEVLAADDGAYVIPIPPEMGYADAALSEPWATVEAAYSQRRRVRPLPGGRSVVVDPDTDVPPGEFDDIVMMQPRSAARVSRAADALAFRGVLNIVGDEPLDGPVDIDVGRIHYHYTAFVGTTGTDPSRAYGEDRNRTELRHGGVMVVVGAAGPMGQMHLERALRRANGPRLVIGADVDAARLAVAQERLEPIASAAGRRLLMTAADIKDVVRVETGGRGVDDVIVTAPVAAAVETADAIMAPDGMLVLFAGLPVGTRAKLDLSRAYLHGAQYTGTSGSRIADQRRVIEKTIAGELAPGRAIAAVGSIEAAQEGLRALMDGRFAGKIVIFPQLRGLPLTSLAELAAEDRPFAAALGEGGTWTNAAEAVLFAHYLPPALVGAR